MGILGDGLSITAWVTKRIDQVSDWIKGRVRSGQVKNIDDAVTNHDDGRVNDIVQNISKKREDRTNAS